MTQCYCCSSLPFEQCCAPLLNNTQKATTPEALMRSRYSAFCTGNVKYLLHSSHSDYLHAENYQNNHIKAVKTLKETMQHTQWLGLQILAATDNTVEFVAFFHDTHQGEPLPRAVPHQLHEQSRFIYEYDRWLYIDGDIKAPIKLGRNSNCYCGSGKKLKKCCSH